MRLFRTWSGFSTRAICASVLLCLFVSQGLFLGVFPKFPHDSHGVGIADLKGGVYCRAGESSDAPAQEHRDHAQCCIACETSGRDALLLALGVFRGFVFCSPPEAVLSIAHFLTDDVEVSPVGWARTWSSRGPPSFS